MLWVPLEKRLHTPANNRQDHVTNSPKRNTTYSLQKVEKGLIEVSALKLSSFDERDASMTQHFLFLQRFGQCSERNRRRHRHKHKQKDYSLILQALKIQIICRMGIGSIQLGRAHHSRFITSMLQIVNLVSSNLTYAASLPWIMMQGGALGKSTIGVLLRRNRLWLYLPWMKTGQQITSLIVITTGILHKTPLI